MFWKNLNLTSMGQTASTKLNEKKRNISSRFHFVNCNFLNQKSDQEKHIQQRHKMTKITTQCQLSLMN